MSNRRVLGSIVYLMLFACICIGADSSANLPGIDPSRSPLDALQAKINTTKAFSMDFKQKNTNSTTLQIFEGNGIVKVSGSSKFDWEYTSSPNNRIVSDGVYVVMLTPETEQVMYDNVENITGIWSPLNLLSSDKLKANYEIIPEHSSEVRVQYKLVPKEHNNEVEYLVIRFLSPSETFPIQIAIHDHSGNSNELTFSNFNKLSDAWKVSLPDVPADYDVTDFQGNPKRVYNQSGSQ